jgi:folylpolyglutamate synthase/dihydropteroate synthase
VASACATALDGLGPEDQLLLTGSLYLVGAARPVLQRLVGGRV